MKEIDVEITGTSPLLMASPKSMLEPTEKVKSAVKEHVPEKEAEKLAYRNEKGKLYVPSTAIKGTILAAASRKKVGKFALKPFIAASMKILEREIILPVQKYDIFTTTAVLNNGGKKSRILVSRPVFNDWKLNFTIVYDDKTLSDPDAMIKDVLEEAGQRVGILAWRPANNGEYGCFKISKWKAK